MTLFHIALMLWLFTLLVGWYNAKFRIKVAGMIAWLEGQLPAIIEHGDYKKEAEELQDFRIPEAKQFQHLAATMFAPIIIFTQIFNSVFMLYSLLGVQSYILNAGIATVNAFLFVILRNDYNWRWLVEGTCRGTQIIIEALGKTNSEDKEEEDGQNSHDGPPDGG